MTQRKRIGVLISGRGSNLKSLIDASDDKNFPAKIVLVISNVPGAAGLEHARRADIPVLEIDHKKFETREEFEDELDAALKNAKVEILCNAGFMRLLTDGFVRKWLNRHLNIHPSLLPSYKGLHTHERALKDGVKIAGCTVHFVRTDMDAGPIIAQAAVPVLAGDTPDLLAARVLKAEHKLYPHALNLVSAGKVRLLAEQVIIEDNTTSKTRLFVPPL